MDSEIKYLQVETFHWLQEKLLEYEDFLFF